MRRDDWLPALSARQGPTYLALAEAIAEDIARGRLADGDHLPTQRRLAAALGLDVTTVARGYREAARRLLVEARVGSGTFVQARSTEPPRGMRRDLSDRSMNLPPEPDDPDLLAALDESMAELGHDLIARLRYQPVGGSAEDKSAALRWLARHRIEANPETLLLTAGSHAALLAVLSELAAPGDVVACEAITYPGIKAIAHMLGIKLVGLPFDREGIDPGALASLCRGGELRAIYLNPTLHNPTTWTSPIARRAAIVEVARHWGIPIVEDDAYGAILTGGPPPIAMLAPEITYHVAGLSKCLGAGLRLAYLLLPDARRVTGVAARLRAATVMASPLTAALASRWIETGIADRLLAAVRAESRARQKIAASTLPSECVEAHPDGFHLWVKPPEPWTRARIVDWMRGQRLGAVPSDAFCAGVEPMEAFRLCLGGPTTRDETLEALQFLSDAMTRPPNLLEGAL
ncbi:MAG: PLP-dependent aminotransferase family protein [Pseudomonadota bacterium]